MDTKIILFKKKRTNWIEFKLIIEFKALKLFKQFSKIAFYIFLQLN